MKPTKDRIVNKCWKRIWNDLCTLKCTCTQRNCVQYLHLLLTRLRHYLKKNIVCDKESVAKSVHLWEMFLNKNASSKLLLLLLYSLTYRRIFQEIRVDLRLIHESPTPDQQGACSLWIVAIFWIVLNVHCCPQTLEYLTGADFTLCCEELSKISLAGAKCGLF